MTAKEWVKSILKKSPIPLSKNHYYDILTHRTIKTHLKDGMNAVDVGAHKGEILDLFLKYSPKGHHFAFEPIPSMYQNLAHQYSSKCDVYNYALSDKQGVITFNHVLTNPSYSGIRKRKFDRKNEKVKLIEVKTETLDDVVSEKIRIDFIKIDVEGAEFLVLKGANKILSKDRPLVLFEHGLGGADIYGDTPEKLYKYLSKNLGYSIYNLHSDCNNPLSSHTFQDQFYKGKEYYFLAKHTSS